MTSSHALCMHNSQVSRPLQLIPALYQYCIKHQASRITHCASPSNLVRFHPSKVSLLHLSTRTAGMYLRSNTPVKMELLHKSLAAVEIRQELIPTFAVLMIQPGLQCEMRCLCRETFCLEKRKADQTVSRQGPYKSAPLLFVIPPLGSPV